MNATVEIIEHEPKQTVAPYSAITPMAMLDRAVEQGAGIEVLTKLMELQERWERNQARKAFDNALAAAKSEIPIITKNRKVDFTGKSGVRTNYFHEDLGEIVSVITPVLGRHGLSHRFRCSSPVGEPITVTCIIAHKDGHAEENTLVGGRDESGNKNIIQAIGSTITYLQRYTLKAALGLAASYDDDGRAAGGRTVEQRRPAPVAAPVEIVTPTVDPETGEIGPRALPLLTLGGVINWIGWGQSYIAALKSAEDTDEAVQWFELNSDTIDRMEKAAPKVHKRMLAAVQSHINALISPDNYDAGAEPHGEDPEVAAR